MARLHKVFSLFIIAGLSVAATSSAQDNAITFQHLAIKEGLTSNDVHCVFQDTTGFIWLGTASGLQRFDGYDLKTYRTDSRNPLTSLSNNAVTCGLIDHDGRMWIGTEGGGLNYFDKLRNIFIHYNSETDSSLSFYANRVIDIFQDSKQNIWVSTLDGLYRVDEKRRKLISVNESADGKTKLSGRILSKIAEDRNGMLWIGGNHGMNMYNPVKDIFYSRNYNPNRLKILDRYDYFTQSVRIDRQGMIWVGTWQPDFFVYNPDSNTIRSFDLNTTSRADNADEVVTSILEEDDEHFRLGTINFGLLLFNKATGSITRCKHDEFASSSISSNETRCIIRDKEKNIWIATAQGVEHFNEGMQVFRNIHTFGNIYSRENAISSVVQDSNGNFWIGNVSYGLCKMDSNFNQQKVFQYDSSNPARFPPKYISHMVYDDERDWLWIASQSGLVHFNIKSNTAAYPSANTLLKQSIRYIMKDSADILWIASGNDLIIRYNIATKDVQSFSVRGFLQEKNNNRMLICGITEGNNNDVWVSVENVGLLNFDKRTLTFTAQYRYIKDKNSLLSDYVILTKIIGNKLYISTAHGGVSVMDMSTKHFDNYTTSDGLPDNNVSAFIDDARGCIWITTDNGLSRFDTAAKKFRNYSLKDGLLNTEFNQYAYCKTKQGNIIAATGAGYLVVFNPDDAGTYPAVPPPSLLSFKIYGKPLNIDSLAARNNSITVSYRENLFSADFASLNFINAPAIQYAYMLKGVDKDWIPCGNRRNLSYANLAGGNYTLQLKCANPDGVWSSITEIPVYVTTAYWKAWWFRFVVAAAVAFITWLAMHLYTRRKLLLQKMEMDKQQRILLERTRISAELHDDLGSGLTKISMMSRIAETVAGDKQQSTLKKITHEASEMVDKMNNIIWALNTKNDSLPNLLSFMRRHANELFEEAEIKLTWIAKDAVPDVTIEGEVRRNIYLVMKESLHNALKYSAAAEVTVTVTIADGVLHIQIADNGKGYHLTSDADAANASSTGNGLTNMRKRMEEINGTLHMASHKGKGTVVEFTYPIVSNTNSK